MENLPQAGELLSKKTMNKRNAAAKAALVELVHACGYSLGQDTLDGLGY